jgi:3-hydroxyisobutyrate dehydrogenase-like beta-hydroxyacid dehydrogenase
VSEPARIIGWLGLGEMGLPMAGNLVRAGHRILGYDVDPGRLQAGAESGIEPAASAAELVARTDLVVTMLRTLDQVESALLGDGGLAPAVPPEREVDVVVMSTLDPGSMRRLAEAAAQRRITVVDAPVSGGVRGAEAGTLAIMMAGPPEALARVRPVLEILGSSTFEVGATPGLGQAVKHANQVMMAVAMAGTLEGLALARRHGLSEEAVLEVVAAGTGASWVLEHWDWMRSLWESYVPGNSLDILIKDMRSALSEADAQDAALPVARLSFERLLATWGLSPDRSTG